MSTPSYTVSVRRIFVPASPPEYTKNGKAKMRPVYIRQMHIDDGVFHYLVHVKGERHYVSRLAEYVPVANAATLFYGSTAVNSQRQIRRVRHLDSTDGDVFRDWLVKCIGKRPAHNAIAQLYAHVGQPVVQDPNAFV